MATGPGDPKPRRRPAPPGGGASGSGRRPGQPGGAGGRGGAAGRGAGGGGAGGGRGDSSYVRELGAVLQQRDPLALRAFLAASARRYGNEREGAEIETRELSEMLLIMHQMIVARPDLQSLHADSQRWLRGHGLDPDLTGESRRN
jgi:hypothetical protein